MISIKDKTISSREKASSVLYCNRKCITHARVLSPTLAHENDKTEICKETEEDKQSVEKKPQKVRHQEGKWAQNKKESKKTSYSWGHSSPGGATT